MQNVEFTWLDEKEDARQQTDPPSPCLNRRRHPQAQARSDHRAGLGETAMGVATLELVAEASRVRVRIGGRDSTSTTI
jgi:hypothetical protein